MKYLGSALRFLKKLACSKKEFFSKNDQKFEKNKKIYSKIFFEFLKSWGTTLCLKMFFRREIHCTDHFWFENEPSKVKPNFLPTPRLEFRVLSGVQPCPPWSRAPPNPLKSPPTIQ